MSQDPGNLRRVTVTTVQAVLENADVPYTRITQRDRKGVVRVDVVAWPGPHLHAARERVAAAFDHLRTTDYWKTLPGPITYPWRPWRSWVTITDPATEYRTADTDYLGNPWH